MLYQMLTGVLPFRGDSMAELMYKIANQEAADVRVIRKEIPERLANAVALALSKRPETRYQDGDQFAADLRAAMGDVALAAAQASSAPAVSEKTVAFSAAAAAAAPAGGADKTVVFAPPPPASPETDFPATVPASRAFAATVPSGRPDFAATQPAPRDDFAATVISSHPDFAATVPATRHDLADAIPASAMPGYDAGPKPAPTAAPAFDKTVVNRPGAGQSDKES
jgi:hypothetical protein